MHNWKGRKIVSQYGLRCEVLDCEKIGDQVILTCLDADSMVWKWEESTVSLVTRENEILDVKTGEIFGTLDQEDWWVLYPEDQCRTISHEEVNLEFQK